MIMSTKINKCKQCGSVSVKVRGEPASKSNSRRLAYRKGRPQFIKSKKAMDLCNVWRDECPSLRSPIKGDVTVWFTLTYASRRPDLDESLIMDLLQGRLIANDRQIKEKHVFWKLDQDDPHSFVTVMPFGMDLCATCHAGHS